MLQRPSTNNLKQQIEGISINFLPMLSYMGIGQTISAILHPAKATAVVNGGLCCQGRIAKQENS